MGPVYRFLGLEVGVVQTGSTIDERKLAYAANVTYGTAKQAGFDLLRDHRAMKESDLVHRPPHYALIDEADPLVIALQHFLRSYPHLCGMTGTAQDSAEELYDFYGLGVVVIPTNRPTIRIDQPDTVFTHRAAKERAIVEEIVRAQLTNRPVLVGTLTETNPSDWPSSFAMPASNVNDSTPRPTAWKRTSLRAQANLARLPFRPTWPAAARTSCSAARTKSDGRGRSRGSPSRPGRRQGSSHEVQNQTHAAFEHLSGEVEQAVVQTMKTVPVTEAGIDLERTGLLSGSSAAGFAVGAAVYATWILIAWGIYRRFQNLSEKRRRRKS